MLNRCDYSPLFYYQLPISIFNLLILKACMPNCLSVVGGVVIEQKEFY